MAKRPSFDQLPTGMQVRYDLANASDMAAALGDMCVAWAALEFRLYVLFSALMGAPTTLTRSIFFSLHTTRNRSELILSVAAMLFRDNAGNLDSVYDELDGIMKGINKTAKKRNAYIHDPWIVDPADPDGAVAQMRLGGREIHGEGKYIDADDLSQLTDQIVQRTQTVRDFFQKIDASLPSLRGKLRETRHITLAFAKKDFPRKKNPKVP